jgi:hypothetical protein
MHHIREHADTLLAFQQTVGQPDRIELPADAEARLTSKLEEAMADLRKHRDVGGFVISDASTRVLDTLFQELDKSLELGTSVMPGGDSYSSYLEYRIAAVDRSLEELRKLARKDLSLA